MNKEISFADRLDKIDLDKASFKTQMTVILLKK